MITPDDLLPLIKTGWFRSHSGLSLPFKIDCDALSDETIAAIAVIIAARISFGRVLGIPRGGLRLAEALLPYALSAMPLLIVDDVLTTGASMKQARKDAGDEAVGAVIFSRGRCPRWIWSLFTVGEEFR